jgi:hypothetical protein
MQNEKVKVKNGDGLIKLEIPSPNRQRSSRFQHPISMFGDWIFSGAWMLEFGCSAGIRVPSRKSSGRSRLPKANQGYSSSFNPIQGFLRKNIFYADSLQPIPTYLRYPSPHPSCYGAHTLVAGKLTPCRQINPLANLIPANADQKIYAPFVYR